MSFFRFDTAASNGSDPFQFDSGITSIPITSNDITPDDEKEIQTGQAVLQELMRLADGTPHNDQGCIEEGENCCEEEDEDSLSIFSNSAEIEDIDALLGIISNKNLDEEEDDVCAKSMEDLISEITQSFDSARIEDVKINQPQDFSDDDDIQDLDMDKGIDMQVECLSDPGQLQANRSANHRCSSVLSDGRKPLVHKRSNEDLKSDGLYQPIEHLYSQR